MALKTNISVTERIIVNGREYDRPEDMPDELRNAYEAAMESLRSGGSSRDPQRSRPTIVFNDREYATEEEMPQEERWLYRMAIDGLKADQRSDEQPVYSAPIEPAGAVSPSGRLKLLFIVGGVILGLLLFIYLFSSGY